jgi:hypothetical protein
MLSVAVHVGACIACGVEDAVGGADDDAVAIAVALGTKLGVADRDPVAPRVELASMLGVTVDDDAVQPPTASSRTAPANTATNESVTLAG